MTSRENKIFEKSKRVAVVMQNPSKSKDIKPILLVFAVYVYLININLHAKNEANLPSGFRDRPIATEAATKFRLRLWWDW